VSPALNVSPTLNVSSALNVPLKDKQTLKVITRVIPRGLWNVRTRTHHFLSQSALNLYRPLRRMFYVLMGSQSCSKLIPINASWTLSCPSLSTAHALALKASLLVMYNVPTTPQRWLIHKPLWSQFRTRFRKVESNRPLSVGRFFAISSL
jgi:hypothetical protein